MRLELSNTAIRTASVGLLGALLLATLPYLSVIASQYDATQRPLAADFTLPASDKTPFTLSKVKRPTLLTFGYLDCVNSCPSQMLLMHKLAEEAGERAQLAWVTLEPSTDHYSTQKHPFSILIPSNESAAKSLAQQYGVRVTSSFTSTEDSIQLGVLTHSDSVFLIDAKRRIQGIYSGSDTSAAAIIHDLTRL